MTSPRQTDDHGFLRLAVAIITYYRLNQTRVLHQSNMIDNLVDTILF